MDKITEIKERREQGRTIRRVDVKYLLEQIAEAQRREKAAIKDMKIMALAMRESNELSEGCCFACICENLPNNCILPYGECPGYEKDDCFEWRGSQDKKGE